MGDNIPKFFFRKPEKKSFEFEVLTLKSLFSRNEKLSHPLNKPHRVEFYQIIFIAEGQGKHYVDFNPMEYSKGSLFFVSMGQVQAFDLNLDSDGFLLLFTEDFLTKNMVHSDMLSFSRLYNYHLYPPDIKPAEESFLIFEKITREIYNEYLFVDTYAKEEILRTLLKLLLLKAERIKRTMVPNEKDSKWILKFAEFRQLLSKKYPETRNADSYADMMGVSYKHLNKIVKSVTGKTAKTFIDNFIILESKRHLAVTDTSIKELTYLMGFDEPTNYVKYFKKHTGQSPAQFKKSIKQ